MCGRSSWGCSHHLAAEWQSRSAPGEGFNIVLRWPVGYRSSNPCTAALRCHTINVQCVACTQAEEVATLKHSREVCQVSWSSLGTLLATVTKDSSVHLWRPNLAGEWSLQSKILASDSESDYVMVD